MTTPLKLSMEQEARIRKPPKKTPQAIKQWMQDPVRRQWMHKRDIWREKKREEETQTGSSDDEWKQETKVH
jgi:hypothetical protein